VGEAYNWLGSSPMHLTQGDFDFFRSTALLADQRKEVIALFYFAIVESIDQLHSSIS
jgi:hypothetical protein